MIMILRINGIQAPHLQSVMIGVMTSIRFLRATARNGFPARLMRS